MLEKITPLILTYNEAPNIERTLKKLIWAKQIVVIDSFSTDQTLEILCSYPQVQIFQKQFDSFAGQCNYGLEKITSEWVLSLDADYVLTEELIQEIQTLPEETNIHSYSVRFKYCVFGKPLSGTLLPPRKVLYKREKAIYKEDGHAHKVWVEGNSAQLSSYIYHDDRKHVSRWFSSEIKYSALETKKLLETPLEQLSFVERVRRTKLLAPLLILIYCLIVKGGIFDGWRGWYYAFQRTLAELILAINLIHEEFTNKQ
ncbi:glycosyltransferase family 2 protein [Nostoc sp. CHAB 5844]|nr:glycosyltransferase family 2 protein [Nostoc sp. CHAB 5844]